MSEIELVKYRQVEKELLELFQKSFGHGINPELWNWKHVTNYLNPADPEVIVVTNNGRIIGARPFLLVEIGLGNEKIIAAQHCDTMVHPEYQRRGLFNLMGEFSLRYLKENGYGISYGFANLQSRPGFIKQGYRIIGKTEELFRLLRPRKILSHRFKSMLIGSITGFAYDKLLRNKLDKNARPLESFHAFAADQFTEELGQVDTLRDGKTVDLVRSEGFLRWRFDSHPEFDYRYITVAREGELVGYAVISARKEDSGLTRGLIIDYLVKDNDITCFQALLNRCLIEFEKLDCDRVYIRAMASSYPLRELFILSGFRSSSEFPYGKQEYYGHLDAIKIQEQIAKYADIYDINNWRLSYAFYDTM